MKILIGCVDFSQRTGMPIFMSKIAREFIRLGHEVVIVSRSIGLIPLAEVRQYLFDEFSSDLFRPDVLLLNEPISEVLLDFYPDVPAYNFIHSPREDDAPIMRQPQIIKYIAGKDEDHIYILSKGIPERNVVDIPPPVDFDYFKPMNEEIRWDIASISTIDKDRRPMLMDLIRQAKEGKRVLILGKDHGGLGSLAQYTDIPTLSIIPYPVDDVRPYIAKSARIASLFRGMITKEAWAMGKPTVSYDFAGKVIRYCDTPPADLQRFSVKVVAQQFIDLFTETWADIIIPHHNRADLLDGCLKSIPKLNYNVIVAQHGGTFAQNCNIGAREAVTDTLIFLNDDTIVNAPALWTMLSLPGDIVGCRQTFPNPESATHITDCVGVTIKPNPHTGKLQYWVTNKPEESLYPSGAIFSIKKELFWRVGGFYEAFRNGGEDQDLFLKCIAEGATISLCMVPIIHFLSQSEGRFDHCDEGDRILKSRWPDSKLKELFPQLCAQ